MLIYLFKFHISNNFVWVNSWDAIVNSNIKHNSTFFNPFTLD